MAKTLVFLTIFFISINLAYCQTNACSSGPCRNNARCVEARLSPFYVCLCVGNWMGQNCDDPDIYSPSSSIPCNQNFYSDRSGNITSPGWPAFYGIREYCLYTVKIPSALSITLNVDFFVSERYKDELYISRGPLFFGFFDDRVLSLNGTVQDGTKNVAPIVFENTNQVTMLWESDFNINRTGFRLSFEADIDNCWRHQCREGSVCRDLLDDSDYRCVCPSDRTGRFCESGVVIIAQTQPTAYVTGGFLTEGLTFVDIPFDLALTPSQLSTFRVTGTNLWRVTASLSSQNNRAGDYVTITPTLSSAQGSTIWSPPAITTLFRIQATFPAAGFVCSNTRYLCATIDRSLTADFVIQGDPTNSSLTGCTQVNCRGVEISETTIVGLDPLDIRDGQIMEFRFDLTLDSVAGAGSVQGNSLWRVTAFASSVSDGSLRIGDEERLLLSSAASRAGVVAGSQTVLRNLIARLDFSNLNCVQLNYFCVEVMRDPQGTPFTLTGVPNDDVLVTCQEVNCGAVRIISTSYSSNVPRNLLGQSAFNVINLDLSAISLSDSATISGTNLWQVEIFTNTQIDGNGRTAVTRTATLQPSVANTGLTQGGSTLVLRNVETNLDLTGIPCSEVQYICTRLSRNPLSQPEFVLEGVPSDNVFISCQGFTCSELRTCDDIVCQNGGTCNNNNNDPSCTCAPGFTGPLCSQEINACEGVVCLFGGTCVNNRVDFVCLCTLGRTGRLCELEDNGVRVISVTPIIQSGTLREGFAINPLNLDVRIQSDTSSDGISGTGLWDLEFYLSDRRDGNGQRYDLQTQTLNSVQASTILFPGSSSTISGVFTTGDLQTLTCSDVTYICAELSKGANPNPDFFLTGSLSGCTEIECQGVEIVNSQLSFNTPPVVVERSSTNPVTFNFLFTSDTTGGSVTGDNLWNLVWYLSTRPDDTGGSVQTIPITLFPLQSGVDLSAGTTAIIRAITAQINTLQYTCDEFGYVCVRLERGPSPSVDFTLSANDEGALSDCVQLSCRGVEVSSLTPSNLLPNGLRSGQTNLVNFNLVVTTSPGGASVSGTDLWTVEVFTNTNINGDGTTLVSTTATIPRSSLNQGIVAGTSATLTGIQASLDLRSVDCSEVPYVCVRLDRNQFSNPDFSLADASGDNQIVQCQQYSCQDPSPCESNVCLNGATCVLEGSGFFCQCTDAFVGQFCGTVNPCFGTNPCQNNGVCEPFNGGFACQCVDGFTGLRCETPPDPCLSNPCQNLGTCVGLAGEFTCICRQFFEGQFCQLEDPCSSNPCENNAQCLGDALLGTYDCFCLLEFKGDTCQYPEPCFSSPCQNNGVCTSTPTGSQYMCTCQRGFQGANCHLPDPCVSNPCQNGGTCGSSQDGSRFDCICPPFIFGDVCQFSDPCNSNPCLNNGLCNRDPQGTQYICNCVGNFLGVNCQFPNPCLPSPCLNNGLCRVIDDGASFTCTCPDNFLGDICQNLDPCLSNPCQNGAPCRTNPDGSAFFCDCLTGFFGVTCRESSICATVPCRNGGTCTSNALGTDFTCQCPPEFLQPECRTRDACSLQPCQNQGTCITVSDSYSCLCLLNFLGINCENLDPCLSNPCQRGGNCTAQSLGLFYTCQCPPNTYGVNCDELDPCSSNPCINGGTCLSSSDLSSYQCLCKVGYTGRMCETVVPCDVNPCSFGGTCVTDLSSPDGFRCMCVSGRTGRTCTEVDLCVSLSPCLNDATCVPDTVNGTFTCVCSAAYTGTRCEVEVPCFINPCLNGGTCIPVGTTYLCQCQSPFEGQNCQFRPIEPTPSPNQCTNDIDFPCLSGECISRQQRCDQVVHCLDGYSDEINCPRPCLANTFACQDGSSCILGSLICDGRAHCQDNSDESLPQCFPCASSPCRNGGLCQVAADQASYQCTCLERFTGPTCEVEVPTVNDPPEFFSRSVITISEGALANDLVWTLQARDINGDALQYDLRGPNARTYFYMGDPTSGRLFLIQPLDREVIGNSFNFTAVVTDGMDETEQTITVLIEDINDNDPVITNLPARIRLLENATRGEIFQVTATDLDLGQGSLLSYSIDSVTLSSGGPDTGNLFTINGPTGDVFLTHSLDFETNQQYVINIRVSDRGEPSLVAFGTLTVDVGDVQDLGPIFINTPYDITIQETHRVGSIVQTVLAEDQDTASPRPVSYRFIFGNELGYFDLNPNTGVLTLAQPLDRDDPTVPSAFTVTVRAEEVGSPTDFEFNTFTITVLDIQDEPPSFNQNNYETTIPEDEGVGTVLPFNIVVTDMDRASADLITLELEGPVDLPFAVSPGSLTNEGSVLISVAGPLDFEETERYVFMLIARESNPTTGETFAATSTVTVNLQDVNDNDPVYTQGSFSGSVTEGATRGTFITTVSATDRDSNQNAQVVYSIVSGNDEGLFQIDSDGRITTQTPFIDFETSQMRYTLIIEATNPTLPVAPATGSSQTQVVIDILDVNDNSPIFDLINYNTSVTELADPGFSIVRVRATDVDSGAGGEIRYSINGGNGDGHFEIDEVTGDITLRTSVDREIRDFYSLTVVATDQADPNNIGLTTVDITVRDFNDNDPVWRQTIYNMDISEGASSNTFVVRVQADDNDIGSNARLTYSLSPNNPLFRIDPATGEIFLNGMLDRETEEEITLNVIVTDNGNPSRPASSPATVLVRVTDINDNPPAFVEQPYDFEIEENQPRNTPVGQVFIIDVDQIGQHTFSFLTEVEGFLIDPATGEIFTTQRFDRESRSFYQFEVVVFDGVAMATTTVNVTITDVNDANPVFNPAEYSASVPEDFPLLTEILSVSATDLDQGGDGDITFRFESGRSVEGPFTLDPTTGLLELISSLDRELQSMYTLTVLAVDTAVGGIQRTGTTTILIDVTDVNDNGPRFTQNPYPEETVPEDVGEGVPIAQVSTTDEDLGNNSAVMYRITQGNVGNVFTIDGNGVITRGPTPLDRETLDFYLLVVEAFDPTNPDLPTDTSVVTIVISDINDVVPQFTQSVYSRLDLTEDTEVGARVIDVQAQDQDLDLAGEVLYQIAAGDDNGYFEIDPITGLITVNSNFPSITETMTFNLTVQATDQSGPFNVGTAYVIVDVLDAGEIAPVFILPRYEVDTIENLDSGSFVVQVQALVENREADLRYSLDPNAHPSVMRHFQVNESTGEITIRTPIDRESIDFFAFTVFATGETISGSTAVWVTVLDANDNTPTFIEFPEDVTVLEGLRAQTVVGEIRATDDDIDQNALVNYRISAGNREGAFTLRTMADGTVTLITTRPLNREFTEEYNITVTAFDSGTPSLESTQTVRITVGDTNDNAPLFTTSSFTGSITENVLSSSPIANLTVSDNDLADSNNLIFTIIRGNEEGKFEVNSLGEISLTSALDRETTDSYQLTVRLEDRSYDPQYQVFVPVYISVLDENDNTPVFSEPSYQAQVGEGLSSVIVTTVAASDPDLGPNSEIRFNVTGDNAQYFSIDPIQGHLITDVELDRESVDEYVVIITATDQAIDPLDRLTATTTVTVDVTDINDTPPSFIAQQYGPYNILEESPNAFIDTIQAIDPDLGRGGTVTYSLIGQFRDYFVINPFTGLLTVNPNRPLDYEEEQQINITVVARDAEGLQSTTDLTVNVININDNNPQFEGTPYSVTISENVTASLAFIATATDADLGPPGVVTYSIIDGNTGSVFWINPNNGKIYINKTLDRETLAGYVLVLEARDNPLNSDDTRVTTTRLTITVSDADDVPPTFPNDRYVGTILENAFIGTLVDMERPIQALDSDEIGSIEYSISGNGSEAFVIDAVTGELRSLEVFDREVRPVYNFTVRARDSRGSYDEAEVYITILDENDNEPVLNLTVNNYTIPENSPAGFMVGQLRATDADGHRVTFSLVSGGVGLFLVDSDTGRITVAPRAVLDREERSSYTLTVSVTDEGSPQLSTSGMVTINLSDINDSPPVFEVTDSSVTISEADRGSSIGIFTAYDPDLDALIRYAIDSVTILDNEGRDITSQIDFSSWFTIDMTTGEVTLVEQIDREVVSEITVVVSATDENGDGDSRMSNPNSMVQIVITDTNDNAPVIGTIDVDVLQEESSVGTIITTVTAEDPDQGEGGEVTFRIVDGDDLPITIDEETGVITVNSNIDREQFSWVNFTIIVADGGTPSLNSTVDVNLHITDINDNNPTFNLTVYTASVNESAPRGECFTLVEATDADAGDFGDVTYTLSGGDGLFEVDPQTGEICLLGSLDRESVSQYTLIVTAKDNPGGSPNNRRETSTTVIVEVTDTNEFPPRSEFEFPFSIPEGEPTGTVVGTIEAVDPDTPDQPLIYIIGDIQPPGAETLFTINNRTGEIILIGEIDSDNSSFSDEYRINIIISDGGNPEQTTVVVSVITIEDLNDTPPTFDQDSYNTSVREDFDTRNPVITVTALDPDEDSVLTYMIVDGNRDNSFLISSDTGEIRFLGTFDHEVRRLYQLIVSVKDQAGQESRVPVEIHITDINDHQPRFTRSLYTFSVCENLPNGTEVGQIEALDNDLLDDNRDIVYSIMSGNRDGSLRVDPETGVITTTRPFDREVEDGFELTVEARNHRAQSGVVADTAVVTIVIVDKNDNTPEFEREDYSRNIQEMDTGTVEALFARDNDVGTNGIVNYRIIKGNTQELFSIGQTNGRLTLNRPVSSLVDPVFEFELVVEAYDLGTPELSSNVTVLITVGDENDRAPIFLIPTPGEVLELPENEPPGYFLVQLNATDQDLGINGQITYSFFTSGTSSGDYRLFTLNSTTGILRANFTADREEKATYTLVVLASDQGSPPRVTPLQIIIQVTDKADTDPYFPTVNGVPTPQEVPPVFENTTTNTVIVDVTRAVDPDVNSTIYYYIVAGNDDGLFSIDRMTGAITLIGTLDSETRDIYNIIIKATNNASYVPGGTYDVTTDVTLKEVVIRVGDVNDNVPTFPSSLIVTGVTRDAQIGSTVITIQAQDPDSTSNVMYSIVRQSFVRSGRVETLNQPVFDIDPMTGRITTRTTFVETDLDGYFLLNVRAVDKMAGAVAETRVQIQVFERDQQVILVIDDTVSNVRARETELIRILSNITGGTVRINDIGVFIDSTGTRDDTRTMVSFHVVNSTTGQIVDSETVVTGIDQNAQSIDGLLLTNGVIDVYPLVAGAPLGGLGWLGALLLALALLLFLGALLFIILLCCLPLWYGAAAAGKKKKGLLAGGKDSYDGKVNHGFDDTDTKLKEYEYQEQVMNFGREGMYHVDEAHDALIMTSLVGQGAKREQFAIGDGSSLTENGYIGDAALRSSYYSTEDHESTARVGTINRDGSVSVQTDEAEGRIGGTFPRMQETSFIENRSFEQTQRSASTLGRDQSSSRDYGHMVTNEIDREQLKRQTAAEIRELLHSRSVEETGSQQFSTSTARFDDMNRSITVNVGYDDDVRDREFVTSSADFSTREDRSFLDGSHGQSIAVIDVGRDDERFLSGGVNHVDSFRESKRYRDPMSDFGGDQSSFHEEHTSREYQEEDMMVSEEHHTTRRSSRKLINEEQPKQREIIDEFFFIEDDQPYYVDEPIRAGSHYGESRASSHYGDSRANSHYGDGLSTMSVHSDDDRGHYNTGTMSTNRGDGNWSSVTDFDNFDDDQGEIIEEHRHVKKVRRHRGYGPDGGEF